MLAALILLAASPLSAQRPDEVPLYTIEQFMNTTTLFGASFSPDEQWVVVTSDESGVFNAYEIPVSGGEARPLTASTTDAVIALGYFPHDRRVLYSSDQGGNELNHLYVRGLDDAVTDLTPGEDFKARFYGWADDDESFFYGTNQRDQRYFDVYEMSLDTYQSELVYENTEGYEFADISPDESTLVLGKFNTLSDNDLYLLNRSTGELTLITPHEGFVSYEPNGFSLDGSKLYLATNEGSEFAYLAEHDIESGERTIVVQPEWDVMYSELSKQGTYRVIGINNDARTEIRVLRTSNGQLVGLADIPEGDITGVTISDSELIMAFYVSGDRSPANLYTYSFETGEVNQLTESMNPAIHRDHLVDSEIIRYPAWDGLEIPSLLFKPHEAGPGNPVPAVLWIHGGPGGQSRVGYSGLRQYLVNHGYALLAVNNRGSSGYGKTYYMLDDQRHGEHDLDDIVWSKRYLAQLGWVDTSRVVIMGGSYGGYLTLAGVTFRPEEFAAGVDLFGISNWVRTLENIPPWWESFREALYIEMGDPATDSERLRRISPLFHADQIVRPLMVLQGANDPRVLQVESDEIVEAVRANGGVAEYMVFEDEGHGFRNKENRIEAYRAIRIFLDRYVKGEIPRS